VIDRDELHRVGSLGLLDRGPGTAVLQRCWYCNLSKHQLGGKRVGRMRLFKCADCVNNPPAKPATEGATP
jgi:hypothetical protein